MGAVLETQCACRRVYEPIAACHHPTCSAVGLPAAFPFWRVLISYTRPAAASYPCTCRQAFWAWQLLTAMSALPHAPLCCCPLPLRLQAGQLGNAATDCLVWSFPSHLPPRPPPGALCHHPKHSARGVSFLNSPLTLHLTPPAAACCLCTCRPASWAMQPPTALQTSRQGEALSAKTFAEAFAKTAFVLHTIQRLTRSSQSI